VIWGRRGAALGLGCGILAVFAAPVVAAPDFQFNRDTPAFANSTVFDYREGVAHLRHGIEKERTPRYTRRCFVMCRTVLQFTKFARFDPRAPRVDDKELIRRIRAVTRHAVWRDPAPPGDRVVIPGYTNLRQLSKEHGRLLQENIGKGWPTYFRLGNSRMFYNHNIRYQVRTHELLNEALARGDLFVAYLSDFPTLHINHAVLVYARKPGAAMSNVDRYNCYDPNHPDGPRELKWLPDKRVFNFEKDEEFVGGYTRVYHVYSKPLQ
jgi:hypothetical protein